MSGGHFNYIQRRYEIEDAIEEIATDIANDMPDFESGNKVEAGQIFKDALIAIKKAQIYLERIDYFYSGDDGEESFIRRVKEEIEAERITNDD